MVDCKQRYQDLGVSGLSFARYSERAWRRHVCAFRRDTNMWRPVKSSSPLLERKVIVSSKEYDSYFAVFFHLFVAGPEIVLPIFIKFALILSKLGGKRTGNPSDNMM